MIPEGGCRLSEKTKAHQIARAGGRIEEKLIALSRGRAGPGVRLSRRDPAHRFDELNASGSADAFSVRPPAAGPGCRGGARRGDRHRQLSSIGKDDISGGNQQFAVIAGNTFNDVMRPNRETRRKTTTAAGHDFLLVEKPRKTTFWPGFRSPPSPQHTTTAAVSRRFSVHVRKSL